MESNDETLGPYRLVEEIGRGGMAVVYRGYDTRDQRVVAVKVIHDEQAEDAHQRRRLLREARAAKAIDHHAVCEVYEVAEDAGRVYIVMELLEGETLTERLARGPLEPAEALDYGVGLADVVQRAHQTGVVHRDIKPDNIMLTRTGLKLLDFGIARYREAPVTMSEAETVLTREGAVVGTPGYMPPEQMLGIAVDERSDIFAIGVTLYAMLAGRLPFAGLTLIEIAVSVVRDRPLPLSEHFADAWPELEETIGACLAKDAEERLGSAGELRDRLRAHRVQWVEGPPAPTIPPGGVPVPSERPLSSERLPRPEVAPYKRAAAGGVVLLIVVLLVVGYALKNDAKVEPPTSLPESLQPTAIPITALPLPAGNAEARLAFGRALAAFRDGAWGRAETELQTALKHDPSMAAAHLRLALFHGFSGAGHPGEARRTYQRAASLRANLTPRDRDLLHALEPMLARTPPNVAAAREGVLALVDAWPGDAEMRFLAAWLALATAKRDEALRLARRASALDPSYADPLQLVGNVLVGRGELSGAEEAFERCTTVSPASADCLSDLAILQARRGDCEAALESARQFATRVDDHTGPRVVAWGLAGVNAKRAAVAAAARRGARLDGDPLRVLLFDMHVLVWAGELQQALDVSDEAVSLAESSADLGQHAKPALLRVRLLQELQGPEAASVAAKVFIDQLAALVDAPVAKAFADPTMEMWRIRHRAGDVDDAQLETARRTWLDRWGRRSADPTALWLGGWLPSAHDRRSAVDALGHRPDPVSWHQAFRRAESLADIGRVELLAGERDAAMDALGQAAQDCRVLQAPIVLTRAQVLLGRAREREGDRAGACRAYRKVIERWAASPESHTRREAVTRAEVVCSP
ncbi:MAG: protein kinase [Myxococcota bacterium]